MFNYIKNPFTIKLNKSNLIESSAGTGKTHLISLLYIRFLLNINIEKYFISLSLDKILVVTFTDLAILEIKERILINIRNLRLSFIKGYCISSEIEDIFNFIKKKKNIINLLTRFEYQIDTLSIFTIHSFCKRILFTNFFETNINYYYKILDSENEFIYKFVFLFWKKYLDILPINIGRIIITYWADPECLFKVIKSFFNLLTFSFQYKKKFKSIIDCYNKILDFINFIKIKWFLNKEKIYREILLLTNNKYIYNKKNLDIWFRNINNWSLEKTIDFTLPKCLIKFSYKYILNYLNTINTFCLSSFYKKIDILFYRVKDLYVFILTSCFYYVKNLLKVEKRKKSYLSFNDLIVNLNKFLSKKKNDFLLNSIRNIFPVALIDEFQDTDILQYNIFNNIYIKNISIFKTIIIFIGDPKQCIYSFRGANINNYIKARKNVKCLYTFDVNWRSSFLMIKSINYLFSRVNDIFEFKDIKYLPVNYSINSKYYIFYKNNKIQPAIRFLVCKNISILSNYKILISKYCAIYILNLLNKKGVEKKLCSKIGNKKIVPSDIAILVYSNLEVELISNVLQKYNLPINSLYIKSNVFHTLEAKELMFIIRSILNPELKINMRSSLSTFIFGYHFNEINYFINDDKYFNLLVNKFNFYRELWFKFGIYSMIKYILCKEKLVSKLQLLKKNQQYIVNILHIAEILQKISLKLNSKYSLLSWLNEQILNKNNNNSEYYIRFNNNINSINISTIHKSKGLQYNIVFLPFLINLENKYNYLTFLNSKKKKFIVDLYNKNKNGIKINKEFLSEEIRLLYVAITRSVYQCNIFLYNLNINKTNICNNSIFRLIDKNKFFNFFKIRSILEKFKFIEYKYFKINNLNLIFNKLFKKDKYINNKIIFLNKRKFFFHFLNKSLYNYTNIINKKKKKISSLSFNDIFFLNTNLNKYKISFFPRGKNTGNFFHSLLEIIEFSKSFDEQIIINKLKEFNFDINWLFVIKKTLLKIFNVYLDKISINFLNKKIFLFIKEFSFILPINNKLNISRFNYIIKKYDNVSKLCTNINIDNVNYLYGFLNGVIDLIFIYKNKYYIVDYKTNWIGLNYKNYDFNSLLKVICNNRYDIQYQFYCLALNNYLKLKLTEYNYNIHFGGIYYIFIRGINPNKNNISSTGIFFTKPNYRLIKILTLFFKKKNINELYNK